MKFEQPNQENELLNELVKGIDVNNLIEERKNIQATQVELVNNIGLSFSNPITIPETPISGPQVHFGEYSQTTFQQQTTTEPLAAEVEFSDESMEALKQEVSEIKQDVREARQALIQRLIGQSQDHQQDIEFESPTVENDSPQQDSAEQDGPLHTKQMTTSHGEIKHSAGAELLGKAASGLRGAVVKFMDFSTQHYKASKAFSNIGNTPEQCYENIVRIVDDFHQGFPTKSGLNNLESNLKQLNQFVNATGIMANRAKTPEQKLKISNTLESQSKYLDKALDVVKAHSAALNQASSLLKHPFNAEKLIQSLESTVQSVTKFLQSIKSTLAPQSSAPSM